MICRAILIGLREGLEATLVVSILVAFLVKADRRDASRTCGPVSPPPSLLSVGFGALLTYTEAHLAFEQRNCSRRSRRRSAVVFVTWMIFWMRRMARSDRR